MPTPRKESMAREKGREWVDTKETNPKDLVGESKVPILSVVPPVSIIWEAIAMRHGAEKYTKYNWREKSVQVSIYIDAVMRHLAAYWDGEDDAQDSRINHLAHAKAGLGVLLDAIDRGKVIDDRPAKGGASELLEKGRKE